MAGEASSGGVLLSGAPHGVEGFVTATRAAAAGGVTTPVDMPLNSVPPTVDVSALHVKRKVTEGQVAVDVAFWGGAVPGNVAQLRPRCWWRCLRSEPAPAPAD